MRIDMKTLAIYAGAFDSIALGRLGLIERSAELFDRLIGKDVSVRRRKRRA